jgi:hypothetical protein
LPALSPFLASDANGTLATKTAAQVVAPVTLTTAGSYNIYAQNGSCGGQSNSLTLVIGTPTPSLTALVTSPSSPTAGQQFTIDISGNNFDPSTAQIQFTGSGCAPCTVSNGSLTTKNATLLIGSTTLSTAGNFTVTVQNSSSGAQSNGLPLMIGSSVPVVNSIYPTSMPADRAVSADNLRQQLRLRKLGAGPVHRQQRLDRRPA